MLAYQLHGERDLRLEEVEVAPVGSKDVRIEVAFNGICGSDIHYYFADAATWTRRPKNIGHEFSGVVAEIGSEVASVVPGQKVIVFPIDSCGSCEQCLANYPVLCEVMDRTVSTVGCGSHIGGLGQYSVLPEHLVIPLPEGISLEQGALVEPIAVATTAVQRANPGRDATILVTGGGPIGIGAVLALEAMGYTNFVVSEPAPVRRQTVQALTKARVVDPLNEDLETIVLEMSSGRGADFVFECAGVAASLGTALKLIRKRGTIVLIGLFERPVEIAPNQVALREVRIVGHNGSTRHAFQTVIAWMAAGLIPIDAWVTHVSLEDAVTEGFEPLRKGERIKVLVDINPSLG